MLNFHREILVKVITIILITVINLVFITGSYGQDTKAQFNPDGWPLPDVQTAQAKSTSKKMLGKVEAQFELFITPEKTMFNRISTNGETWAYLVDTDGEPPMEYILIRSNKFANFDKKVPASENVLVPDWIQN